MAESQSIVSAAVDHESAPGTGISAASGANTGISDGGVPHGEHEDNFQKLESDITRGAISEDNVGPDDTNRTMLVGDTPAELILPKDTPEETLHQPTAVGKPNKKPSTDKSNGGPPTPLVKKIISSGTFGSGAVKPAAAKSSNASKPAAPSASPVKKSASSSSAQPTKQAMVPKLAASLSASLFGSAANRRASMAPKESAPPITKPTLLSSSTKLKPPPATATITNAPARTNTVSPTNSSNTRPRASLSEGLKKPLASARLSISPATKATSSKPPVTATRPPRTTTSISSIKEVKEDGKLLEDLQNSLKETTNSLASKMEVVTELEAQVTSLNASLETAVADSKDKCLVIEQLEQAKVVSDCSLNNATEALEKLRTEYQESDSALHAVKEELEATKANATSQTELVQRLQAQIQDAENELQALKSNLETFRAANESAAVAAAAAAIEHEALMKAKADLDAIQAETESLKAAHAEALNEAALKLQELEGKAFRMDALQSEAEELKKEKEENASKLSELEIEILELKESQEAAEDERGRSLLRIKAVEDELSKAISAVQQATEEAKIKEGDNANAVEALRTKHEAELKAVVEQQTATAANLEALRSELIKAQAAHEQAQVDARAAAEDHAHKLEVVENIHVSKQTEFTEEIKRVTVDLQAQQELYAAKVDAVKAEHDQLLQEAFERAKNEAGVEHSNELQALRAESKATTEQLRTAQQSAIEALKAEHDAALDEQVKALCKKIDHQNLDLKATQDDLAKAKVALDSAHSEVNSLKVQRDEARAAAEVAALTSPQHLAEIDHLTNELSRTKDDLAALTEMLNLTKTSLTDVSNNHAIELSEAAKGRAEEVTKLRAAHDAEMTALAKHKSELLMQMSDLEGELATLKASILTSPVPPSPKSNGNGVPHIPPSGVTREELQQMHEAHNLKLHDLQAEHDRSIRVLKEEMETLASKADGLQQEVSRRTMEIQYLEQEQEDSQDQVTRMKEDIDSLTEQLKAKGQPVET